MRVRILFTTVVLTFAGCGFPKTAQNLVNAFNNGKEQVFEKSVCYDGVQVGQVICMQTVGLSTVQKLVDGYDYRDPKTAKDFPTKQKVAQYQIPLRLIDLKDVDESQMLAPHFKLGDFMEAAKGRFAMFSKDVITQIEKLRIAAKTPVIIHSGYRNPTYNEGVSGSATWSRHMYGDALDFSAGKTKFKDLKKLCNKYGASFVLIYAKHIHCDWRNNALADDFFGPPTAPALSVAGEWTGESPVKISTQNFGSLWHFSTVIENEELEDEPLVEWTVTHEDGTSQTYEQAELNLPRRSGSNYHIKVVVGDVWSDEIDLQQ